MSLKHKHNKSDERKYMQHSCYQEGRTCSQIKLKMTNQQEEKHETENGKLLTDVKESNCCFQVHEYAIQHIFMCLLEYKSLVPHIS